LLRAGEYMVSRSSFWSATCAVAVLALLAASGLPAGAEPKPAQRPEDPKVEAEFALKQKALAAAQADLKAAHKAEAEAAAARDALRKELDAEKAQHAATRAKLEQANKDLAREQETLTSTQ